MAAMMSEALEQGIHNDSFKVMQWCPSLLLHHFEWILYTTPILQTPLDHFE
jgi:hypothetical protein